MRAGRYVKQVEGYRAFLPTPLPPDPPLVMDTELIRLLSEADRSLGRLDGVTSVLPNPDLFVAMYVRHEAVLSSQIEGTQSTLEDVLQFEIDVKGHDRPKDVEEVVNYVHAMNYGLERLKDLPFSLRLITFLLCQRGVLQRPLLYLSYYLKTHRAEYYDRLMAIRNEGNWEGWLKFFLRGIYEVSQAATVTARVILSLREGHRQAIAHKMGGNAAGLRLLDFLFEQPLISVRLVEQHLQCSYVTASKLVEQFVELDLLRETTGWQRNRRYRYEPYLVLFEPSGLAIETPTLPDAVVQTTRSADTEDSGV